MNNLRHAYLYWQPVGHLSGCRRPAWDVQTFSLEHSSGISELGMRAVCWGCGTVHDLTTRITPDTDLDADAGGMRSEAHQRLTATWVTGYGQPAIKAAGLWLHPGPAVLRRPATIPDPVGYFVTTTPDTPRTATDVAGVITRNRGARGGTVWSAGIGYDPPTATRHGLPSRGAAARWIAATITAQAARP
ncbi:hypothetical protein ACFYY8_25680 [Streptosporangium sp. NPDC001559]|uniref:hypothetical protein n=1 Tax=Streptosporangium sp. NPDC001559 TaxID=3366187 RepID=UPI0036ED6E4A